MNEEELRKLKPDEEEETNEILSKIMLLNKVKVELAKLNGERIII